MLGGRIELGMAPLHVQNALVLRVLPATAARVAFVVIVTIITRSGVARRGLLRDEPIALLLLDIMLPLVLLSRANTGIMNGGRWEERKHAMLLVAVMISWTC